MPDCFISHSSEDAAFAKGIHEHLTARGVQTFLAPVSMESGAHWSPRILSALRESRWVIFLASRKACASSFVQQEVGGAVVQQKKLVPIVWDMDPSELPAWTKEYQAINIRGASAQEVAAQVAGIAARIREDKAVGAVVLGAAIAVLIAMMLSSES